MTSFNAGCRSFGVAQRILFRAVPTGEGWHLNKYYQRELVNEDEVGWVSSKHVRDQEFVHNCNWNSPIEGSSLKNYLYME